MALPYANRTAMISIPALALDKQPALTMAEVHQELSKVMQSPLKDSFDCIQRTSRSTLRFTFRSAEKMEALMFVGLTIRTHLVSFAPIHSRKWVTVSRVPYGIPREAIDQALRQFGPINRIRQDMVNGISNGEFSILMEVRHPIPCRLTISGHSAYIRYRGQQQTCYRCGQPGHTVQKCPKSGRAVPPPDATFDDPSHDTISGALGSIAAINGLADSRTFAQALANDPRAPPTNDLLRSPPIATRDGRVQVPLSDLTFPPLGTQTPSPATRGSPPATRISPLNPAFSPPHQVSIRVTQASPPAVFSPGVPPPPPVTQTSPLSSPTTPVSLPLPPDTPAMEITTVIPPPVQSPAAVTSGASVTSPTPPVVRRSPVFDPRIFAPSHSSDSDRNAGPPFKNVRSRRNRKNKRAARPSSDPNRSRSDGGGGNGPPPRTRTNPGPLPTGGKGKSMPTPTKGFYSLEDELDSQLTDSTHASPQSEYSDASEASGTSLVSLAPDPPVATDPLVGDPAQV